MFETRLSKVSVETMFFETLCRKILWYRHEMGDFTLLDSFIMLEYQNQLEIVVKKSKFLAFGSPISSVEDAEVLLAEIRTVHKSANHNCFAYSVGLGVPIERFSDDGEPSGTAGRPILEVVRRKGIRNVLVVVTRYFGGVLLGASGLVRAYADGAASVLDAASCLKCQPMHVVTVCCDYGLYGKLEYELTQLGYAMTEKTFESDVVFQILISVPSLPAMQKRFAEWSGGRALVTVHPAEYVGVRPDGSFVRAVWPAELGE